MKILTFLISMACVSIFTHSRAVAMPHPRATSPVYILTPPLSKTAASSKLTQPNSQPTSQRASPSISSEFSAPIYAPAYVPTTANKAAATKSGLIVKIYKSPKLEKPTKMGKQELLVVPKTRTVGSHFIFDFPITYNARVKFWIKYFQTSGRKWFQTWLERSPKYLPVIQQLLRDQNLPEDLVYVAMIESGFSTGAKSTANAVGIWQFIPATGNQYGLSTNYWLDERRDVLKSTKAAIKYKKDLFKLFGSWYLVAASYNTGENRIKRLINKYHTNDFWQLADAGALSAETVNYVPKIIAAALIAKAPALYGFRNLSYEIPMKFEMMEVPGGIRLNELADYLGVRESYLKDLNPELLLGYIPPGIKRHTIRVPEGARHFVSSYVKKRMAISSF